MTQTYISLVNFKTENRVSIICSKIIKWIFFSTLPTPPSPQPIRLCSLSLPAVSLRSKYLFLHFEVCSRPTNKPKRKQINKSIWFSPPLVHNPSPTFSCPVLPKLKNDPLLKGTMEKKYCTHLKTCVCRGDGRGAPPWGLKVQRMQSLLLNPVAHKELIRGKWQGLVSSLRKRKEIQKLVAVGTITDKKIHTHTHIYIHVYIGTSPFSIKTKTLAPVSLWLCTLKEKELAA